MALPFAPFAIANTISAYQVSQNVGEKVPPMVMGLTMFWMALSVMFFGLWAVGEGLLIGWLHGSLCYYGPEFLSVDIYTAPGFLQSFCDHYFNSVKADPTQRSRG